MAFSKAAFQAFLVIVLVGAVYGSKKVHGMNVVHGSSKVYGVFENPLLGYVKGKVNPGLDKDTDTKTFILADPSDFHGYRGGRFDSKGGYGGYDDGYYGGHPGYGDFESSGYGHDAFNGDYGDYGGNYRKRLENLGSYFHGYGFH